MSMNGEIFEKPLVYVTAIHVMAILASRWLRRLIPRTRTSKRNDEFTIRVSSVCHKIPIEFPFRVRSARYEPPL